MINIQKDSVIYVLCPSFTKSGGPELAHQLVNQINNFGGNAQIAYYDIWGNALKMNEAFKRYTQTFVDAKKIVDETKDIVIVPETHPEFLNWYKKAQKCIWWMSVDNYLRDHDFIKSLPIFGFQSIRRIKNTIVSEIKGKPYISNKVFHFYQSEYAKQYLKSCGVTNTIHLSDYLNKDYLNVDINTKRLNAVLYNPKKGLAFTQKLMKAAPDIKWIPLQNMTTEQVKETLLHSKVYIDFGNHPGKDRFPREAAMCGCCVITGKRGSAKFFEDVPIDNEFKYDESAKTIPLIISKIRECLDNYETESSKFNGYREFIKGEYQTFQDDVKSIFISNEITTK